MELCRLGDSANAEDRTTSRFAALHRRYDFKYINDQYGHTDGAGEALALQVAQRILGRVAEPLRFESGLTVSVSIGCALLDVDDPIDAADHAMLRAKRRGRGLVAASKTA